jgi:hypothetical protein
LTERKSENISVDPNALVQEVLPESSQRAIAASRSATVSTKQTSEGPMVHLTIDEWVLVVKHLRVAAAHYDALSTQMTGLNRPRLAMRFRERSQEAVSFATRIETSLVPSWWEQPKDED